RPPQPPRTTKAISFDDDDGVSRPDGFLTTRSEIGVLIRAGGPTKMGRPGLLALMILNWSFAPKGPASTARGNAPPTSPPAVTGRAGAAHPEAFARVASTRGVAPRCRSRPLRGEKHETTGATCLGGRRGASCETNPKMCHMGKMGVVGFVSFR